MPLWLAPACTSAFGHAWQGWPGCGEQGHGLPEAQPSGVLPSANACSANAHFRDTDVRLFSCSSEPRRSEAPKSFPNKTWVEVMRTAMVRRTTESAGSSWYWVARGQIYFQPVFINRQTWMRRWWQQGLYWNLRREVVNFRKEVVNSRREVVNLARPKLTTRMNRYLKKWSTVSTGSASPHTKQHVQSGGLPHVCPTPCSPKTAHRCTLPSKRRLALRHQAWACPSALGSIRRIYLVITKWN